MNTKSLVTDGVAMMIKLPIEREVLASRLPEPLMRKIKLIGYTPGNRILVRFHHKPPVQFAIEEWLTEECLARIAWEAL